MLDLPTNPPTAQLKTIPVVLPDRIGTNFTALPIFSSLALFYLVQSLRIGSFTVILNADIVFFSVQQPLFLDNQNSLSVVANNMS